MTGATEKGDLAGLARELTAVDEALEGAKRRLSDFAAGIALGAGPEADGVPDVLEKVLRTIDACVISCVQVRRRLDDDAVAEDCSVTELAQEVARLRRGHLEDWSIFSVCGRGAFPVDMLRRDKCWPASAGDAARIAVRVAGHGIEAGTVTVTLQSWNRAAPMVEHWKPFGWTVVDVRRWGDVDAMAAFDDPPAAEGEG